MICYNCNKDVAPEPAESRGPTQWLCCPVCYAPWIDTEAQRGVQSAANDPEKKDATPPKSEEGI